MKDQRSISQNIPERLETSQTAKTTSNTNTFTKASSKRSKRLMESEYLKRATELTMIVW